MRHSAFSRLIGGKAGFLAVAPLIARGAGDFCGDDNERSGDLVAANRAVSCGDSDDLPPRVRVDEAGRTLDVGCDADPGTLALTALDDGIVRMRYGANDRGS